MNLTKQLEKIRAAQKAVMEAKQLCTELLNDEELNKVLGVRGRIVKAEDLLFDALTAGLNYAEHDLSHIVGDDLPSGSFKIGAPDEIRQTLDNLWASLDTPRAITEKE